MLSEGVLLAGDRLGWFGSIMSGLSFNSVTHDDHHHVYVLFVVLSDTLLKDPNPILSAFPRRQRVRYLDLKISVVALN